MAWPAICSAGFVRLQVFEWSHSLKERICFCFFLLLIPPPPFFVVVFLFGFFIKKWKIIEALIRSCFNDIEFKGTSSCYFVLGLVSITKKSTLWIFQMLNQLDGGIAWLPCCLQTLEWNYRCHYWISFHLCMIVWSTVVDFISIKSWMRDCICSTSNHIKPTDSNFFRCISVTISFNDSVDFWCTQFRIYSFDWSISFQLDHEHGIVFVECSITFDQQIQIFQCVSATISFNDSVDFWCIQFRMWTRCRMVWNCELVVIHLFIWLVYFN